MCNRVMYHDPAPVLESSSPFPREFLLSFFFIVRRTTSLDLRKARTLLVHSSRETNRNGRQRPASVQHTHVHPRSAGRPYNHSGHNFLGLSEEEDVRIQRGADHRASTRATLSPSRAQAGAALGDKSSRQVRRCLEGTVDVRVRCGQSISFAGELFVTWLNVFCIWTLLRMPSILYVFMYFVFRIKPPG